MYKITSLSIKPVTHEQVFLAKYQWQFSLGGVYERQVFSERFCLDKLYLLVWTNGEVCFHCSQQHKYTAENKKEKRRALKTITVFSTMAYADLTKEKKVAGLRSGFYFARLYEQSQRHESEVVGSPLYCGCWAKNRSFCDTSMKLGKTEQLIVFMIFWYMATGKSTSIGIKGACHYLTGMKSRFIRKNA